MSIYSKQEGCLATDQQFCCRSGHFVQAPYSGHLPGFYRNEWHKNESARSKWLLLVPSLIHRERCKTPGRPRADFQPHRDYLCVRQTQLPCAQLGWSSEWGMCWKYTNQWLCVPDEAINRFQIHQVFLEQSRKTGGSSVSLHAEFAQRHQSSQSRAHSSTESSTTPFFIPFFPLLFHWSGTKNVSIFQG